MPDLLLWLLFGAGLITIGVLPMVPSYVCFWLADHKERDWPGWACDYLLPGLGVVSLVVCYGALIAVAVL